MIFLLFYVNNSVCASGLCNFSPSLCSSVCVTDRVEHETEDSFLWFSFQEAMCMTWDSIFYL